MEPRDRDIRHLDIHVVPSADRHLLLLEHADNAEALLGEICLVEDFQDDVGVQRPQEVNRLDLLSINGYLLIEFHSAEFADEVLNLVGLRVLGVGLLVLD